METNQIIEQKLDEAEKFSRKRNFEEALKTLNSALELYEKDENEDLKKSLKAGILFRLGNQYFLSEDLETAKSFYEKSAQWCEQNNLPKMLGRCYHSVGNIFATQKIWNKALENYELAINQNYNSQNFEGLGASFYNTRIITAQTFNFKKRLKFYEKKLKQSKKENKELLLGYIYHELAIIYNNFDKKEKERAAFEKAFEYKQKYDVKYEIATNLYYMADYYDQDDEEEKAFEYYLLALDEMLKTKEYEHAGPAVQYIELSLADCQNSELKTKAENMLKQVDDANIFNTKKTIFGGIEIGEYNT